jgi:hypothetical protein
MGKMTNAYQIMLESLGKSEDKRSLGRERRSCEGNVKIIITRTGCICLVATSREYNNEPSGSMKGGDFLDRPSNYYLLKKHSAPST